MQNPFLITEISVSIYCRPIALRIAFVQNHTVAIIWLFKNGSMTMTSNLYILAQVLAMDPLKLAEILKWQSTLKAIKGRVKALSFSLDRNIELFC